MMRKWFLLTENSFYGNQPKGTENVLIGENSY